MKLQEIKKAFIEKFKECQKKFGEEEHDLTPEMKHLPEFRRLDALARLLESVTNCVAISIFDNKLIIAANKILTENAREKQSNFEKLIINVIRYFNKIANSTSIDEFERLELFHNICNPERFIALVKSTKAGISIKTSRNIVDYVFKHKGRFTYDNILVEFGRDISIPMVAGICKDLYDDFICLEESIEKAATGNFSDLTQEQFITLKKGEIELLPSQEARFHAEMQIVFYLLEKQIKDHIYIGISKLCCLNCHVMLSVINDKYFKGILFLVRGWHDRLEDAFVPENILLKYDGLKETYNRVLRVEKEKIEKRKKNDSRNFSMKAQYSESSSSQGEGLEHLLSENLSLLNEAKIVLRDCLDPSLTLEQNSTMIEIGLLFHSKRIIKHYCELFDVQLKNEEDIKLAVTAFIRELLTDKDFIIRNYNLILRFFNSNFFNSPIKEVASRILKRELLEVKKSIEIQMSGSPITHAFDAGNIAATSTLRIEAEEMQKSPSSENIKEQVGQKRKR